MRTKIKILIKKFSENLRSANYSPKVVCIGFNKTGTSSCGKAFEMMGYRNLSYDQQIWRDLYKNGKWDKLIYIASKYDSFDDLPWLKEDMIALLDKKFPGSKFIYLERDEESWKKSIYNWTHKEKGHYPDMDKVLGEYRAHREFVINYFKDRPLDLLKINVSSEDAFEKLAAFLGKKVPQRTMPHENKT